MRPTSPTPSLASLSARLPGRVSARIPTCVSALFLGLALSVSASFAIADNLPDNNIPEIQRLIKQGQMPQALEKADAYIATRPKDAQGRFMKGLILTEMGRPTEAIAVFTKLTEDFPELPEPYNNLAVLYAQQKQYEKARTALEMAIRTHPSYAIAHENLGDVYAKLASQAYDKALQLDSANAITQSKLSLIHELISTSAPKSGSRPVATPARPAEPTKPAATAAATIAAVTPPAKPVEKTPAPVKVEKPVEKAADKAPETKPAPAKPVATGADEADLDKALRSWAAAWSRKDVKAYLAHYAANFQPPNGASRKTWEAERAQRIDKPGKLQINVEEIKMSIAGDKATVKFRQHYTSASLKSSTSKTIVFIKSVGKWLILQERVG